MMFILKYLLTSRFSWIDFVVILSVVNLMTAYSFWVILALIPLSGIVVWLERKFLGEANRGIK